MSATEDNNQGGGAGSGEVMPRGTRYYYLHAEQQRAKQREKYNNDPEVIRKRQEREAKKAAKEAETEKKKLEREQKRLEKLALAKVTSQKKSESSGV